MREAFKAGLRSLKSWRFLVSLAAWIVSQAVVIQWVPPDAPWWVLLVYVVSAGTAVVWAREDAEAVGYKACRRDAWVQKVSTEHGAFLKVGPAVRIKPETVTAPYPVTEADDA